MAQINGQVERVFNLAAVTAAAGLPGSGRRNLAVELLERLEGEIKSRFASNVVQEKKLSELLSNVITPYQNRSIETARVMEELIAMAKKFREAANPIRPA